MVSKSNVNFHVRDYWGGGIAHPLTYRFRLGIGVLSMVVTTLRFVILPLIEAIAEEPGPITANLALAC